MKITVTLSGENLSDLIKAMRELGYNMCSCAQREHGIWTVKGVSCE